MSEESRHSTVEHTTDESASPRETPKRKLLTPQRKAAIMVISLLAAGCLLGLHWIITTRSNIATDNAFIESNIHPVSSRVPGTVIAVHVQDNQLVRKGDLLVELDSADYRVAVQKAVAAVGVAQNETSGDDLQVAAAKAALESAKARHDQSVLDLKRGEALFAREVIPKEQLDRLRTNQRVALAQLQETNQQLKKAEALVGIGSKVGQQAQVRQKQAEQAEAALRLSYTRIVAPADGYITRKGVETGATIQAGQALMAVVPLDETWVTANYKESQLTHIRPGQPVDFTVDTYPGRTFKGRVDSIMAGTGAAFSLLPPENATGNYVKVVQRIPVKILIDHTSDPEHLLRVGMSVIPVVHTGRTAAQVLRDLSPFR